MSGHDNSYNTVSLKHPPSMGFARLAEDSIRKIRGKGENEKLGAFDKIIASSIGGALATWNQPIEVIRVEVPTLQELPVTGAH